MWPCRVYSPSTAVGRASVRLARTSEPPCFSVMPMPASAPVFSATGRSPGSYDGAASRGVHSLAIASSTRSAGIAAYVIEIGQPCPGSVCDHAKKPGGPADVRVRAVGLPGRRLQPVADAALHQPVPGRVEAHLVDPVAVAVVRRELGVELVGQHPVLAGLRRAGHLADRREVGDDLGRGVPGDGVDQCGVAGDDVVADQRRGLVRRYPVVDRSWPYRSSMAVESSSEARSGPLSLVSVRDAAVAADRLHRRAPACATASPGSRPRRPSSRCSRCRR